MGTTSLCLESERPGSSRIFLHPSDIGNLGTFLCLWMDGRLSLITSRVRFLGCFIVGGSQV